MSSGIATESGQGVWAQDPVFQTIMDDLRSPSTHELVGMLQILDATGDHFYEAARSLFERATGGKPSTVQLDAPPVVMGTVNQADGASDEISVAGLGQLKIQDPVGEPVLRETVAFNLDLYSTTVGVSWTGGVILQAEALKAGTYPVILANNKIAGFVIFVIGTTDSQQCAFGYYTPSGTVPFPVKPVQYYSNAVWTPQT
ncbi:hypothetical protein RhiJN_26617 [Ceratobasidium sp. AG-Ba]|nr:hypothetical protein RhiJN_12561 [Ceratobasidium sp. AG-Ba]QRV98598.1 hypothetical protein RhiJN_26617 [Ceratobasidium sp. AG-Ba]